MLDNVNSTLLLSIASFIYLIALTIFFTLKKKIKSDELSVFKQLIISNIICIIFEGLITVFSICNLNGIHLVLKVFNVTLFTYIYLLCIYSFVLCIKDISKKKNFKGISLIVYIMSVATILLLPVYFNNVPSKQYSYGPSVSFLYFSVGTMCIISLTLIFTHLKRIKLKKAIPFFVLVLLLIINVIVQRSWPQVLLVNTMFSLLTFIMYHTIENPDIRMIELLNIEKDRADKANNAKTEFLSSMSHEIRTPLNAIDGFSQLILEENNIDTIKEEAKDIMAASQNLLEIVNGILDISKIEADKLEIVNVEYEPSKIFNDVAVLAKSRIGEKPIEFKEHIAEDLPDFLMGDYTRIKQITLNLLTNAVKYTKDGYVDYSVRCVKQGDICRLIIMVKDTGIGIKKDNIDKLFNKFERFDKEQNITIEGTGLGLAITKKLVDLMNGRIIVDSRYGTGSIFAAVIDQRIVDKVKTEEDIIKKEQKISFAGKKVLVVDDNKINLKVASRLLASYKVDVETAISGFECLEKINSGNTYDIILMDDMMPKLSGTETFKKLKEKENFTTPVIALTANAIAGMRENYLKEGFNDYISKPIDKKELERVLNKCLM